MLVGAMGEAKLRGAFEKRQAEAVKRDRERAKVQAENRPRPLGRKMSVLAVAAAMGAGGFFPR